MKATVMFPLCADCFVTTELQSCTPTSAGVCVGCKTRATVGRPADMLVGPLPPHPVLGEFKMHPGDGPVMERRVVLDELVDLLPKVFECLDASTALSIKANVAVDFDDEGFVIITVPHEVFLAKAILQARWMS